MSAPRENLKSVPALFEGMRSDYNAAKENRFRRRRRGYLITGSNADFHYRLESDFWRMIEYARAMDRDDAIIGSTIDKAVTNTIHNGIRLDVKTGNDKLNAELKQRWTEWAEDPDKCDLAGELTFGEIEGAVYRAHLVDGDHIVLPTNEGSLQLFEAHLCRTPKNTSRNVIHGVELAGDRRRISFFLSKEDIDPWTVIYRVGDMTRYFARDEKGDRQVLHLYNPKRVSQTRGVTALAPIFDTAGQFEDINFAKLVQQQTVSCVGIFHERALGYEGPQDPGAMGERSIEQRADGSSATVEGFSPGMRIYGKPGETLKAFAPGVPNPEFFPHVKLMLTLIGINLGLPLVMVLMDASETNFSGFRGAIEQARLGFRRNQKWFISRFHAPVYKWKVRQWLAQDRVLQAAAKEKGVNVFGHVWNPPAWPYIEPSKDAAFDLLRTRNALISHRRRANERNLDWDELTTEIVEDNVLAIRKAKEAARVLNQDVQDETERVHWRECMTLPLPDGINIAVSADDPAGPVGATGSGSKGNSQPAPQKQAGGGENGR